MNTDQRDFSTKESYSLLSPQIKERIKKSFFGRILDLRFEKEKEVINNND